MQKDLGLTGMFCLTLVRSNPGPRISIGRHRGEGGPRAAALCGELAGLGRKRPSRHGLGSGLDWERARVMRNLSTGSERRVGDRDGACDGERRNGDDVERLPPREAVRDGENRSERFLTTAEELQGRSGVEGGRRSGGSRRHRAPKL